MVTIWKKTGERLEMTEAQWKSHAEALKSEGWADQESPHDTLDSDDEAVRTGATGQASLQAHKPQPSEPERLAEEGKPRETDTEQARRRKG